MTISQQVFCKMKALALIAVCLVFTAVSSAALADTKPLRVYIPSDPVSLDPAYWGNTADAYLMFNVMPRLTTPVAGPEWQYQLDILESIDRSDPMKWPFTLRKGMQWANGYGEITAEDIKFSLERHLDDDVGSYIASEFETLDHVEVTGTYTGIIHFKTPGTLTWEATFGWYGGTIISKKEAEENDGTLPIQVKATYGPYTFAEYSPGERMVLKAYDGWHGPKPEFDEVVLVPIGDANAAELAFAADELDYLFSTVTPQDQLRELYGDRANIEVRPTLDIDWLGMNIQHPNLSDPRVRRAIQLGVDVESILATSYEGLNVSQATGIAAPGLIGHRPANLHTYDPDAARALIRDAGAEGMTIELSHPNFADRSTTAQIIQANLAEIGLQIEINAMDPATYWDISAIKSSDRQLTLKGWGGNPEPMYMMQYFVADQFDEWNWEGFSDPRYDELMAMSRGEPDTNRRSDHYVEMQSILEESGAFLFLSHPPVVALYRNDITAGLLPDGGPMFAYFKRK